MTTNQIQLVKNSWSLLRNVKPEIVADTFYSKLFFDNPELRSMFPADMKAQYNKLITMLNVVVARLEQLDTLAQDIADLARRHKTYSVKAAHFTAVGGALLWTLERGLGNDWTYPVANAWVACYTILSDAMIAAMREEELVYA